MYKAIGNRGEQDKVRERNEDNTHCKFLKDSPIACESLPYDLGKQKEGDRCPNNPLVRHPKLYERLDDCSPVLQKIEYLEDALKILPVLDPEDISPEEAETIRVLSLHEKLSSLVLSQGSSGAETSQENKQTPGFMRRRK